MGDVRIGISGWRYKGWRDSFYPRGLKQASELQFAAALFQSIEINGTHYSLQSLDNWQRWYAETPYLAATRKRRLRHAVEVRHASFVDPAFVSLLRQYGVGLVVSDSTEAWPHVEDVTADFIYIRLHGTESKYAGAYPDAALDRWAACIEAWRRGSQPSDARLIAPELPMKPSSARDVFCYFDNDVKTQAPFDAQRLMASLGLHRT